MRPDGAAVWGDGYALIGSADGYRLIDVATGEPADATTWPSGTFAQGCCGEGDVLHTDRLGGIVVATDGGTVSVYYPAARAAPTTTVTPF